MQELTLHHWSQWLMHWVVLLFNVDQDFSAGGYSYKLGLQQMNGEEALAYSRERHSFADGDNVRENINKMF